MPYNMYQFTAVVFVCAFVIAAFIITAHFRSKENAYQDQEEISQEGDPRYEG